MSDADVLIDGQCDAVIFDMDGLLLDSERVVRDIWIDVARAYGYTLPEAVYLRVVGTTAAGTLDILQAYFGPGVPVAEMQNIKTARLHEFRQRHEIALKPGAQALLAVLKTYGLPIGLATSTARVHALDRLAATGILSFFDAVVCGDQVLHGKPAPDIYLRAAEELGVKPAQCLALEDSLNGMRAAVAAGMRVIMVPDLVPPNEEAKKLAWRIVPSLDAITPPRRRPAVR